MLQLAMNAVDCVVHTVGKAVEFSMGTMADFVDRKVLVLIEAMKASLTLYGTLLESVARVWDAFCKNGEDDVEGHHLKATVIEVVNDEIFLNHVGAVNINSEARRHRPGFNSSSTSTSTNSSITSTSTSVAGQMSIVANDDNASALGEDASVTASTVSARSSMGSKPRRRKKKGSKKSKKSGGSKKTRSAH